MQTGQTTSQRGLAPNYDDRFAGIERRLGILTWQVGTLATVLAAVGVPSVWLLLRIAAKVGALG